MIWYVFGVFGTNDLGQSHPLSNHKRCSASTAFVAWRRGDYIECYWQKTNEIFWIRVLPVFRIRNIACGSWSADRLIWITNPDPGGQLITDPTRSGSGSRRPVNRGFDWIRILYQNRILYNFASSIWGVGNTFLQYSTYLSSTPVVRCIVTVIDIYKKLYRPLGYFMIWPLNTQFSERVRPGSLKFGELMVVVSACCKVGPNSNLRRHPRGGLLPCRSNEDNNSGTLWKV